MDEGLTRDACGVRRSAEASLGVLGAEDRGTTSEVFAYASLRLSARRWRHGLATARAMPAPAAPAPRLLEEQRTLLAGPSLKMQSLARSSSCIWASRATASCRAASPCLWLTSAQTGCDPFGATIARGVSK